MRRENMKKFKNRFFPGIFGMSLFVLLFVLPAGVIAATPKLNLEIANHEADNDCGSGGNTHVYKWNYRITNNDSSSVDRSLITVKLWFNHSTNILINSYYGEIASATRSSLGTTCGSGSRLANQVITLTFSSGTIAAGGNISRTDALTLYRDGWAGPFDQSCDDYSLMPASSTFTNSPYFAIYYDGELVCEYTNSTTEDSNTGVDPCTGASGCETSPIQAAKSASVVSACVGDVVTFCITATNTGSAAHTFNIWDTVPTGLTYSGCDNSCTQSGGVVSWTVTSLAASSAVTRCYWVTVNALPFYEFNRVMFAGLRERDYLYFAEPVLMGVGSAAQSCEDCGLKN